MAPMLFYIFRRSNWCYWCVGQGPGAVGLSKKPDTAVLRANNKALVIPDVVVEFIILPTHRVLLTFYCDNLY